MKRTGCLLLISMAFLGACIFPNKKLSAVRPDTVEKGRAITTPTKVFLKNGAIVLFQAGFAADETMIKGLGVRYEPEGPANINPTKIEIPLDNVAAMTYYETEIGGGRWLAAVIQGLTSPILTGTSLYCLICPKCCFGSCPTVYVKENDQFKLTAELFSFSVGRFMEADDLDLLAEDGQASQGPFEMRVTNEALETHRINFLRPLAVIHPRDTRVYPDSNGHLLVFRKLLPPSAACNSQGEDVLDPLMRADGKVYRSPRALVERMKSGPVFDHLDLKLKVPPGAAAVNLLLHLRNTLLSTLLFYDLVLGSQGLEALNWTEKMNGDPDYAGRFWTLYRFFSGITVKVRTENGWMPAGKIHDTGPIAFKHVAARIPTFGREELEVRLEFVPDNFMIDDVSYDVSQGPGEEIEPLSLDIDRILDGDGHPRPDVQALVSAKDDRYLTVDPGQAYRIFFNLPVPGETSDKVSVFVASRGYYYEWLRGKWLSLRPDSGYRFDINDVPGTLRQLADRWLSSKEMLEENFFKARIPIRGER